MDKVIISRWLAYGSQALLSTQPTLDEGAAAAGAGAVRPSSFQTMVAMHDILLEAANRFPHMFKANLAEIDAVFPLKYLFACSPWHYHTITTVMPLNSQSHQDLWLSVKQFLEKKEEDVTGIKVLSEQDAFDWQVTHDEPLITCLDEFHSKPLMSHTDGLSNHVIDFGGWPRVKKAMASNASELFDLIKKLTKESKADCIKWCLERTPKQLHDLLSANGGLASKLLASQTPDILQATMLGQNSPLLALPSTQVMAATRFYQQPALLRTLLDASHGVSQPKHQHETFVLKRPEASQTTSDWRHYPGRLSLVGADSIRQYFTFADVESLQQLMQVPGLLLTWFGHERVPNIDNLRALKQGLDVNKAAQKSIEEFLPPWITKVCHPFWSAPQPEADSRKEAEKKASPFLGAALPRTPREALPPLELPPVASSLTGASRDGAPSELLKSVMHDDLVSIGELAVTCDESGINALVHESSLGDESEKLLTAVVSANNPDLTRTVIALEMPEGKNLFRAPLGSNFDHLIGWITNKNFDGIKAFLAFSEFGKVNHYELLQNVLHRLEGEQPEKLAEALTTAFQNSLDYFELLSETVSDEYFNQWAHEFFQDPAVNLSRPISSKIMEKILPFLREQLMPQVALPGQVAADALPPHLRQLTSSLARQTDPITVEMLLALNTAASSAPPPKATMTLTAKSLKSWFKNVRGLPGTLMKIAQAQTDLSDHGANHWAEGVVEQDEATLGVIRTLASKVFEDSLKPTHQFKRSGAALYIVFSTPLNSIFGVLSMKDAWQTLRNQISLATSFRDWPLIARGAGEAFRLRLGRHLASTSRTEEAYEHVKNSLDQLCTIAQEVNPNPPVALPDLAALVKNEYEGQPRNLSKDVSVFFQTIGHAIMGYVHCHDSREAAHARMDGRMMPVKYRAMRQQGNLLATGKDWGDTCVLAFSPNLFALNQYRAAIKAQLTEIREAARSVKP